MNGLTAHPRDIVRVHAGVSDSKGHNLSGMHLTVHANSGTVLDLTEWTGGPHISLGPQDVDLIARIGGV